ncbi:RDD family protein [Burkholderia pseudomallei]|uniref:RDD family protein n=1 Tax=Burkholderia pseudomallei TaxID=28450 RepID=UPI00050E079E|nr:RDD family protein [Burkholderia pseudomallei]KGC70071.1 RDD family protein [Burkholderia pseudomallei]
MTGNETLDEKAPCDGDRATAAGFWRRTAAFAIDGILLSLIGMAVIALGFEWLARIGAWGRLIGFAFGSLYFTLMEGTGGRCQSFGKQALKIKVVRGTPDRCVPLTASQAWARYVIVAVPLVLGGIGFVDVPMLRSGTSWLAVANSLIVFLWGAALFYLLVYNRPTRRSLHDLAVSAMVVRVKANAIRLVPVSRAHWITMSVACALLATGGLVVRHWADKTLTDLSGIQQAIVRVPGVRQSAVSSLHQVGSASRPLTHTSITAVVDTPALQTNDGALEIARAAFADAPMLANQDRVTVVMVRGVDLGIATWRQQFVESLAGREWAAKMHLHP